MTDCIACTYGILSQPDPLSIRPSPRLLTERRHARTHGNMGIIRTTLKVGVLGFTGGVAGVGAGIAYLSASIAVVDLPRDNPWSQSKTYRKFNPKGNPALEDDCIKRVPLSAIRPELRNDEKALTLEFCRGIWSRWGRWPIFLFTVSYFILFPRPYADTVTQVSGRRASCNSATTRRRAPRTTSGRRRNWPSPSTSAGCASRTTSRWSRTRATRSRCAAAARP